MTRFLSETLQAPEPSFRLGLRHLEKANGHPNTDIRFSAEVMQASRNKLREFGLDPNDTTAEELYHSLQSRLQADDGRLTRSLRTLAATQVSAEANLNEGLIRALRQSTADVDCYAMKAPILRNLLKQQPPKKALKKLGYRSLDSMLKHESSVQVLAAAWLVESSVWRARFTDQYKRLSASDFEQRKVIVDQPSSARWQNLATEAVASTRHTVLSFKEMAALIVLPLPEDAPSGSVTATLSLALHALNEIYAASSYLKLCQLRRDFGAEVRNLVFNEPQLRAHGLDQAVPWRIIQRFYARMQHLFMTELFEPQLELRDMSWRSVESVLTAIEPSFHVWESSAHLGLLHHGQVVSMNLLDAALNYCNAVPFEARMREHYQNSLWHELLMRYLQPGTVEQTVLAQLQPNYATEIVTAN